MTGLSTDKGCFEIVQVIQDKLLGYFLFSSLSDNSLRSWLATFPHRVYLMSTDSFFVQRGHAHGHCYRLAYYDHTKSKGLSRIEAICWENIMGQWVHYNKQIFSYISKGSCPLHAAEESQLSERALTYSSVAIFWSNKGHLAFGRKPWSSG